MPVMRIGIDGHLFQDFEAHILGELPEVFKGDNPDVRCIVPLVRELSRDGCIARSEKLKADPPMTEVGKADDSPPPYAQKGKDQLVRFIDLLQGLTHDDVVKCVVRVIQNFFIDVALEH